MAKFSVKKNISSSRIIVKMIGLILVLWVGSEILDTVSDTIDTNEESFFYKAFDFLGMNDSTHASGIIVIIGILAVASLALEVINVQL